MRKIVTLSTLLSVGIFIGCGGGSDSDGTIDAPPKILLNQDILNIKEGETISIPLSVENTPDDLESVTFSLTDSSRAIDYVTYIASNQNSKDIDIILYGIKAGEETITINAQNLDSNISKTLRVNVTPKDEYVNIADGDLNFNNRDSEVREISESESGVCKDSTSTVVKADLTLNRSDCNPDYTYITDSTLAISESEDELERNILINLMLRRYDYNGDRYFADTISDIDAIEYDLATPTGRIVPNNDKTITNGIEVALRGLRVGQNYELEVDSNLGCLSYLNLSLTNLCVDSDGDGVPDDADSCPSTSVAPKFVNESGCYIDDDGDGVFDFEDKCLDTPEGVEVDESGCEITTSTTSTTTGGNSSTTSSTTTGGGSSTTSSTTSTTSSSSTGGSGLEPTDDEYACTTSNGYVRATHKLGIPSFVDGYIYFRTETTYELSLYYKKPSERDLQRQVDLNSYTIPNSTDVFYLKISSVLADGSAFYVGTESSCFKGYFPELETIERGIFPDKTLTFVKSLN